MDKTKLGILVLLGVSIVGLIGLVFLGKPVDVLTPIITALLGFLAGSNKEAIVAAFRK